MKNLLSLWLLGFIIGSFAIQIEFIYCLNIFIVAFAMRDSNGQYMANFLRVLTIIMSESWGILFQTIDLPALSLLIPKFWECIDSIKLSLTSSIYASYKNPDITTALTIGGGYLDNDLKESFKVLGIYHLLVISAAHVKIFCSTLISIIKIPVNALYTLRFLSISSLYNLHRIISLLSSVFSICYSIILSQSPPGQRAALSHAVHMLFPLCKQAQSLILIFFLQSFMYPHNFFNTSNYLSWGISIIIIGQLPHTRAPSLNEQIIVQLKISAFILLFIDNISFCGIFLNIIITPIFGLIFCIYFLSIVSIYLKLYNLCLIVESVLSTYLKLLILLADLLRPYSFFYWKIPEDLWLVKISFKSLALLVLLNSLYKMSKR